MTSNEALIGRADVNDVDAILAITNTDVDEVVHAVRVERRRDLHVGLRTVPRAAVEAVREGEDVAVERERPAVGHAGGPGRRRAGEPRAERWRSSGSYDLTGTPVESWGEDEWTRHAIESQNWTLSQFLHGEQGALICTAQIVETVPWIDAKYYAATQVVDEARHVEVFARYLDTKLSGHYPINAHLKMLLDDIIADNRWDMTYLGMQIMVEGLALAVVRLHAPDDHRAAAQAAAALRDERRSAPRGVRCDLAAGVLPAAHRGRDPRAPGVRVRGRGAHARPVPLPRGVGAARRRRAEMVHVQLNAPDRPIFQAMLFSKIVPNCKKLGLLDAADGWLRERFTELGVIQFEDWVDTSEEYAALDEVAADRAVGVGN